MRLKSYFLCCCRGLEIKIAPSKSIYSHLLCKTLTNLLPSGSVSPKLDEKVALSSKSQQGLVKFCLTLMPGKCYGPSYIHPITVFSDFCARFLHLLRVPHARSLHCGLLLKSHFKKPLTQSKLKAKTTAYKETESCYLETEWMVLGRIVWGIFLIGIRCRGVRVHYLTEPLLHISKQSHSQGDLTECSSVFRALAVVQMHTWLPHLT